MYVWEWERKREPKHCEKSEHSKIRPSDENTQPKKKKLTEEKHEESVVGMVYLYCW